MTRHTSEQGFGIPKPAIAAHDNKSALMVLRRRQQRVGDGPKATLANFDFRANTMPGQPGGDILQVGRLIVGLGGTRKN
ncbi:hypothetical protein ROG8370_03746 [Roseovarius gaetbuli]|uniref:Uncharacterized protein n=1 Tax=Roseovarius gaetbuli TaxID=1356575 RepID=A0A1X7ACB4_9RHOB|nr:hypothetical protein ROG8370_03746 [Roseovarius gaetbuli]